MSKLTDLQGKLLQKQQELADLFEKNKNDAGEYDLTPEKIDDIRARNKELADLGGEVEKARELDEIYQKNREAIRQANAPAMHLPLNGGSTGKGAGEGGQPGRFAKSLGELFTEHRAYKGWKRGSGDIQMNLEQFDPKDLGRKTLMTTSAGFAPETTRIDRVIESAQRRPMVEDYIPQTTTDQSAIVYMEETTFTNSADATSESGSYPESALAYTERSETVRKISTFLPVTDEQLEDVAQVDSLINNRLTLMMRLKKEAQIISGSGVAPQFTGFLNKSGLQTQAKGADPVPDAVYKAMTLVRHTGFADVTLIVFHPNDWQDVRLLKDANGNYIWGSPAEPGIERMWGVPVVSTTAQTENTGLLGDYQLYSEIFNKRGIEIKVSDSHGTYFVEGKQAIRADLRAALVIYRAAAFCKVTGI